MSALGSTDASEIPEPVRSGSEQRVLEAMEFEREQEAQEKSAVWAFIWTLFVFKIVTMILIVYLAAGSSESLGVALATTWYWFLIPIAAISGPLLYRWRLIRQRRKREALRESEWMTTTVATPGPRDVITPDHVTIIIHRPDDDGAESRT